MAFFNKAEATVTSAFYLVPLTPSLVVIMMRKNLGRTDSQAPQL